MSRRAIKPLDPSAKMAAAVLFIGASLLYLLFPSANYNGDGLAYARVVEQATAADLWTISARLLYCPTGRFFTEMMSAIGLATRSVFVLQSFNSIMAALGASFVLLAVYRAVRSVSIATAAGVGVAVSFGFWFWGINCTSYPGNIALLCVVFYFLTTLHDSLELRSFYILAVLAGVFHALAGMYWLTAVLLTPSVALIILFGSGRFGLIDRLKASALYGIVFSIVLFAPLLFVAWQFDGVQTFGEFRTWLSRASHNIPPELSAANFMRGIIGFANSLFRMVDFGPYVKYRLIGTPFVPEASYLLPLEIAAFSVFWLTLLGAAVYILRRFRDFANHQGRMLALAFLWGTPPLLFGLVWLGSDTERWLALTPVFWLVVSLVVWHLRTRRSTERSPWPRRALWGFVIALFAFNFGLGMYPQSRPENNSYMLAAEGINSFTEPKDLVLLWGQDHVFTGSHMDYFFGRPSIHVGMMARLYDVKIDSMLSDKIALVRARGGKIYVIDRMIAEQDKPQSRWTEGDRGASRQSIRQYFSRYDLREAFTVRGDIYFEVRELTLPAVETTILPTSESSMTSTSH